MHELHPLMLIFAIWFNNSRLPSEQSEVWEKLFHALVKHLHQGDSRIGDADKSCCDESCLIMRTAMNQRAVTGVLTGSPRARLTQRECDVSLIPENTPPDHSWLLKYLIVKVWIITVTGKPLENNMFGWVRCYNRSFKTILEADLRVKSESRVLISDFSWVPTSEARFQLNRNRRCISLPLACHKVWRLAAQWPRCLHLCHIQRVQPPMNVTVLPPHAEPWFREIRECNLYSNIQTNLNIVT